MTATAMQDRLETLSSRLQKYAARHASPTCTADDLYQIAAEEILTHCSPEDNDTYMLRLANWRMQNAVNSSRVYTSHIVEDENDIESDDDDDNDGHLKIADVTNQPEEIVVMRETSRRLGDLLAGLKPDQLTIVQMLADGINQSEIARALNTSSNLVNYHVGRIRLVLQSAGMTPALVMG